MMKVAVQNSSLHLHSHLFEGREDVTVQLIPSEDLVDVLRSSVKLSETDELADDCFDFIVLNSEDVEELSQILDFFIHNVNAIERRPKIILLSRLLSWGSRKYKVPIGSSLSEFNSRNPYLTEEALYKVENKFQTCASMTGLDMCILGIGLIYGSKGYDLAETCKSLFMAEPSDEQVVFSYSEGSNSVPMIHYRDMLRMIEHLTLSLDGFPNFFVPAVDYGAAPLKSVLSALSKVSNRNIRCTTEAEAIDEVMNSSARNSHHMWDLDMTFSDSCKLPDFILDYPNGMIDRADAVWREFQGEACSQPCSILVAGPPASLKTTLSKQLAKSLGLKYIDWEESIRNCLEHFVEKKEPGDGSESNVGGNESTAGGTIDLSKVGDTKVALRIEIERSIRVFKKMKDDAILDVNDIVFDKSLLSALPKNLVIEAIAAQLQTDEMCLKRGYVLDIWGAEEKLLQSKQQLFEITNTRPPKVQPAASSIPQNESTEEQSYASVDSYSYCNKDVTSEEKRPQIIVELQNEAATCVRQYLAHRGIVQTEGAKLPKDQLATVKDIEERTNAYFQQLKPMSSVQNDVSDSEDSPGYLRQSHPLVLECEDISYPIVRINANEVPPTATKENNAADDQEKENEDSSGMDPTQSLVHQVYQSYVKDYGKLDWVHIIVDESPPGSVADSTQLNVGERLDRDEEGHSHPDDSKIALTAPMETDFASAPVNRIRVLNDSLRSMGVDFPGIVKKDGDILNKYLVENVLPHLAEALVTIQREKIADPVFFMAEFLKKRGEEIEAAETEKARQKFLDTMKEAKVLEQAAAEELQRAVENSVID